MHSPRGGGGVTCSTAASPASGVPPASLTPRVSTRKTLGSGRGPAPLARACGCAESGAGSDGAAAVATAVAQTHTSLRPHRPGRGWRTQRCVAWHRRGLFVRAPAPVAGPWVAGSPPHSGGGATAHEWVQPGLAPAAAHPPTFRCRTTGQRRLRRGAIGEWSVGGSVTGTAQKALGRGSNWVGRRGWSDGCGPDPKAQCSLSQLLPACGVLGVFQLSGFSLIAHHPCSGARCARGWPAEPPVTVNCCDVSTSSQTQRSQCSAFVFIFLSSLHRGRARGFRAWACKRTGTSQSRNAPLVAAAGSAVGGRGAKRPARGCITWPGLRVVDILITDAGRHSALPAGCPARFLVPLYAHT